jgi:hypothetical protein
MILNTIYDHGLGNKRKISLVPVLIVVVCLVIVGFGLWSYLKSAHNPIPNSFRKEISFSIFYPTSQSPAIVNESSFKYDASSGVFSFIVIDADQSITVAEQASPQSFVDIPQAYTTLIDSLNNYASFDSLQGQVALTYPKDFNGQQSAVMNAKGTLMFAHDTDRGLSNTQWQQFFNDLTTVQ